MKVNNDREAAILNLIELKNFTMHPVQKSHKMLYSNGLAIYHGLPNISNVEVNRPSGRQAAILNLIKSKVFKMHPLLKRHILFYSNCLAI